MSEASAFADLLARVRAGDEQAAAELVRTHESALRRWVRFRLTDPTMARALDPEDVCQSVFASFFVRAAAGQYDLAGPDDLVKLLVGMARNKLAMQARRHRAAKRDGRRRAVPGVEEVDPADGAASPSRQAAGRELLAEVRRRLGDEERRVADLRAQGQGWAEIAAELGGTPDGRRMQLTRALDRVSRELGLG
jgi:RNA polymerase sigma-70 factor (ECF subfamily)